MFIGWYETKSMEAWMNIFLLTEQSRRLGDLSMIEEAWMTTLNPWWNFIMDCPCLQLLGTHTSAHSKEHWFQPLSERLLRSLKEKHLDPGIRQRKILLEKAIEFLMTGNLFMVKLLQFSMKNIACTLVSKTNQAPMGVLKHLINLFPGILDKKTDLTQAWSLREVGKNPSPTWFDFRTNPFPIMNIITWNCRGVMKPNFKKTLLDLVAWHKPIVMVITETRMGGDRANVIIRTLPFNGAYLTKTIGYAAGYGFYGI